MTSNPISVEVSEVAEDFPWPDPPNNMAFHGLAGDYVRLVEPHSEADPMALLIQYLVAFGNVVGRGPYLKVEATQQHLNLFVVLVGASSRARKGTAWGHIHELFSSIHEEWAKQCIKRGLSSGEGFAWSVRDFTKKRVPIRDHGRNTGAYEEVVCDEGVDDKRILVIEEEFSSPLQVMKREGNILSATLRCAWDKGDLEILTKNSSAKATGAHASVVGHITKDELLRCFDTTEAGNGFGNRFLWFCIKRSKLLPEGGCPPGGELADLALRLDDAIKFAKTIEEIKRDDEARAIWLEVYPELTKDTPGILGAVISRAEAQVSRLSCFYALLDKSPVIKVVHLRAALALWSYAEQSARFIFGDRLGYPEADEILRALRANPQGLTRTQIQLLFQRNKTAEQIHNALRFLVKHQFAKKSTEETEGRPAERWMVAGFNANQTKDTK